MSGQELSTSVSFKELLIWRMFAAILTSISAQFLFISCVILIVNFRIMHPLTWLTTTWASVTCIRTWSYFVILSTVIFLQGVICSKEYLTAPIYRKTRFSIICNMLRPHNILVCILHVIVGGVLVWLHISLQDGQLTIICNGEESCLVEEHFFLILAGLWIGLYFFIKSNFVTRNLCFPIIPRSKFSQIKSGLAYLLPHAMLNSVSPILFFMFFYFLDGGYCRETILSLFSIQMQDPPIDTIYGLLNLTLIFYTWLFATLFLLTMNTMHLALQAHLTQRVVFDIDQRNAFIDQTSGMSLADALAMDRIPIIQHLAYLDLLTLAQKEKERRSILFTLSTPGCRPCNWNSIAVKCMGLISSFTAELNRACAASQKLTSSATIVNPGGKLLDNSYQYRMRSLTASKLLSSSASTTEVKQNANGDQFLTQFYRTKRDQFVAYLLTKPVLKYVFEEATEDKIRHLFANAQPVIWAAEGISSLIVTSLSEDQYGVIQQDLPTIIGTLLALKEALDKLHKANVFIKRTQSDYRETRQMITSLRSATKRSVYRISTTFKDYIKDLPLESDVVVQLQSFLSYRE